jgi:hypothetical protein
MHEIAAIGLRHFCVVRAMEMTWSVKQKGVTSAFAFDPTFVRSHLPSHMPSHSIPHLPSHSIPHSRLPKAPVAADSKVLL